MTKPRNIIITSALTYANGEIHLGHLLEAIQTDIWKRFQLMRGNQCYYICGSDAHGAPIMLAAEKNKISPELWVEQIRKDHINDYAQFHISFDNYYTTHSDENKKLSLAIYERLKKNGDINIKTVKQFFDPEKNLFLADRFIRGECPKCGAKDQYGDNCEVCGATYDPTELKNPRSAITGAAPIEKESEHYFFALDHYSAFLETWTQSGTLQPAIANKLKEWFKMGLQQWNISRDAPYFGFSMPDVPNKYFYVWLDAPVGYIASFKNFCDRNTTVSFDDYWHADSKTELYHVIGKDIISFHALFWPAMLHASDYRLPTQIFVHGFVTVNGEKMSKSRGTFITAKKFAQHIPAEYLRYYYAAKLNNQVEDIDFNLADFAARVNSDLVGKYVNLASRCAGFITKKFNGKLASALHDETLFQDCVNAEKNIAQAYESLNYHRAVRDIMALADRANQYIDQHKPWSLAKETGRDNDVLLICTQGLNCFRLLTLYLKPILPVTAEKVENFLNIAPLTWADAATPLLNHKINTFTPLMQRVMPEQTEPLQKQ
ncbi:MAG: methionine--tRNA ligase [Gammaproteobacteria bacterium CG_4_10_14_0_8_um_filter_38_16]|nr:MAG: methionine--tRNA ligase [Gammaproteobacteria bacterium CG_4_10_14_0_8_um_filter_38_16]PJA03672.1 MAG: methionine--tRNA ligase [Gammaproteobacteria bacterium CG_4_10_14_0_2_um_filter_38_22]PJB11338.1 MAG: methionine--tRNA ligase [Gammaproteobacteria bacterium CG_4_9_14_3_um_filter_38_9]